MTTQQLRQLFLDYFADRDHLVQPSAPLVLHDDDTSLFTSAGMQPYMAAFRGEQKPPAPRAVSIQKCLRIVDIEGVGHHNRYATFFEMMGNFSFGDYFKEGGIELAWDLVTNVLGLPKDDLYITVHTDDDEAEEIWHKHIGVPMERISRLGREDNWWPKDRWEGPCGPCSEIHLDLGPEYGCDRPDCTVGCDCDRYLELWNLVFQMYTEAEDGTLTPLPAAGIDTGLGLERLALVMQGVRHLEETDEMAHIMDRIVAVINEQTGSNYAYGDDAHHDLALRIITDHLRAATFILAEGTTGGPANEGAGYVLRRFIRRSFRYGGELGATEPFLHKAIPAVTEAMGQHYTELREKEEFSAQLVRREEERFASTLRQGMSMFEEIAIELQQARQDTIPGEKAFTLYDTYGFPVELTVEMAAERGLKVDMEGFEEAMAAQRVRSGRGAGLATAEETISLAHLPATEFVGYETQTVEEADDGGVTVEAEVVKLSLPVPAPTVKGGAVVEPAVVDLSASAPASTVTSKIIALLAGDEQIDSAKAEQDLTVILDTTPFYAEQGGQVGDEGIIHSPEFEFAVRNTVSHGDKVLHIGTLKRGTMQVGDEATAAVDTARRRAIMRNHTGTHLLHAALRKVVGEHVSQSGSLVAPDRLRFDFTHHEAVTADQLGEVERICNEWILDNRSVSVAEMDYNEARDQGAIAIFTEKYDQQVRTVTTEGISMELCGGTHVSSTGEIGSLLIISESSIAAGIRRIEAVTGMGAVQHQRQLADQAHELAAELNCPPDDIATRLAQLTEQVGDLRQKARTSLRSAGGSELVQLLMFLAVDVDGVKLISEFVPGQNHQTLGDLVDQVIRQLDSGVVVLMSRHEGRIYIACRASATAIGVGAHAGELGSKVADLAGGGGGGKAQYGEGAGKDDKKIFEALDAAADILKEQLADYES